MRYCTACGTPLQYDDANFCTKCGQPVQKNMPEAAPEMPVSQHKALFTGKDFAITERSLIWQGREYDLLDLTVIVPPLAAECSPTHPSCTAETTVNGKKLSLQYEPAQRMDFLIAAIRANAYIPLYTQVERLRFACQMEQFLKEARLCIQALPVGLAEVRGYAGILRAYEIIPDANAVFTDAQQKLMDDFLFVQDIQNALFEEFNMIPMECRNLTDMEGILRRCALSPRSSDPSFAVRQYETGLYSTAAPTAGISGGYTAGDAREAMREQTRLMQEQHRLLREQTALARKEASEASRRLQEACVQRLHPETNPIDQECRKQGQPLLPLPPMQ